MLGAQWADFQVMPLFRVGWEKGASWEVGAVLHRDLGGGCMGCTCVKTHPLYTEAYVLYSVRYTSI